MCGAPGSLLTGRSLPGRQESVRVVGKPYSMARNRAELDAERGGPWKELQQGSVGGLVSRFTPSSSRGNDVGE